MNKISLIYEIKRKLIREVYS